MTTKNINTFRSITCITVIENIVLVLIISFTFYITLTVKTTRTLFVPQGSIGSIISHLSKKGYDLSIVDKYILRILGLPKTGWIYIGTNESNRIDFLYKLTNGKAMIRKVTLIPGETLEIFFDSLAKKLDLDKKRINDAYKNISFYPEAGIYADTYHVPYGIKERHLMNFLIRESEKKYENISNKVYGLYEKKRWLQILIIASIIQKEAADKKEMPLISSVIYNRLKKGMRLQMDGTLNYGKYSHIKVTAERIKTDTSTFNTYKHKGLPISPIGSVGIFAIKAAIKPAKTDYLYFVRNKHGKHDFADTFKKHKQNIKK